MQKTAVRVLPFLVGTAFLLSMSFDLKSSRDEPIMEVTTHVQTQMPKKKKKHILYHHDNTDTTFYDPYFPPPTAWDFCRPDEPVPSNPLGKSVRGVHYDADYDVTKLAPSHPNALRDTLCNPNVNKSLGVTVLSRNPCVAHIANFLSKAECDDIVKATEKVAQVQSFDHRSVRVPFPYTKIRHSYPPPFANLFKIERYASHKMKVLVYRKATEQERACREHPDLPHVHHHVNGHKKIQK